jgi:ATP-dependent RNA helicase DeaD
MFTTTPFSAWKLKDELQAGLVDNGWEFATQVQKDTIPIALQGKDVIGQARTGSGKTAAFGLPTMNACQPTGELQALILTPTRELANQVAEELITIQGEAGLTIITVYGGTDLEKQARALNKGVDIIVGTPGRVMDMTKRGHIDLAKPSFFVLDEADRMLDMGFFPDIMWVVERMTGREQTLLFSATFPQEIIDAANEFMNEPDFVLTNTEKLDIPPIDQYSVRIGRANKLWVVGRLLSRMSEDDQTIIFTNTKRMVDLIVQRLKKHRFDVEGLHGDMSQNQREKIISTFKDGNSSVVVATDVAARGIDVDGITLVINYDVPDDVDNYVHRIGRTGRIGRKGEAWVLVGRDDMPQLNKIIATHSLEIIVSEAPELPDGVDRDPVRKQEDNAEAADVFGMVPIRISTTSMSKFAIVNEITTSLKCPELAVGDIVINDDYTVVEVHNKHASLAVRSFNSKDIDASIIES